MDLIRGKPDALKGEVLIYGLVEPTGKRCGECNEYHRKHLIIGCHYTPANLEKNVNDYFLDIDQIINSRYHITVDLHKRVYNTEEEIYEDHKDADIICVGSTDCPSKSFMNIYLEERKYYAIYGFQDIYRKREKYFFRTEKTKYPSLLSNIAKN